MTASCEAALVVCALTEEAVSEDGLVSDVLLDSSGGNGFLASSALNPGGGNPPALLPCVEVSVE